MDRKLYMIAAKAVKSVYDGNHINIGSVEYADTIVEYQGKPLQVLAIGGTNELLDWFWNLFLASWDGVKICSYLAANLIQNGTWGKFEWMRKVLRLKSGPVFVRQPDMPLLIAVHSKSGPTGEYYKQKFCLDTDYCVPFCPARGFRNRVVMTNTTIFIDPDDPVPKLGALNFDHPICEREVLPNDPGWSISDHFMEHIFEYLNQKKQE